MNEDLKLLKELTDIPAASGDEFMVADYLAERLKKLPGEITRDRIGSLIFDTQRKGPRVMFAGHMDEVGLMVKEITKEGYLKFQPIGGWYSQVMLGQKWLVKASNNKLYTAITGCKPPHLLSREEANKVVQIKDMYLDLGLSSKEEVEKLGIEIGCYVTPKTEFELLNNNKYMVAKAWDNRIGSALVLKLLEDLKTTPNHLFGTFSVQEEVGLRGAQTMSYMVNPEIAIAIDSGIGADVPGGQKENQELGKGPQLIFYDGGLLPNRKLRKFVIELCEKNHIPYQNAFLEGGTTDAARMQFAREGAAAMCIGVPTRYLHSHTSIIHLDDYNNTLKLLKLLASGLDEKEVKKIISF